MQTGRTSLQGPLGGAVAFILLASARPAPAKTLIDYFQPTPIVCPLTSQTWGASGVVPRDVCNGLEDATNAAWQYWDGKILLGADGKYHLYAGRWPQNKGFADWPNSVIVEAVSNATSIGSYVPLTTAPFTGKEQNVTGVDLDTGGFLLLDSPGKIYETTSLSGTWTATGTLTITANGSTVSTATTENQSIWQSLDGSFLIISRTFQEMTSAKNVLGPYVIQATIPNLQSQGYEDPVVWCSGGQYHLVANMYNARKATHFTSNDGVHNWVNQGLAYDPTADFIRYTDGTVNHWYKLERPGVFMESGHVTAFTFAAIDVDKSLDLANDNHGSKIVVVPFDGAGFDRDNPGPGSAACPIDVGGGGASGSGMGGAAGGGGGAGGAGGRGAAGARGTGGTGGLGGISGEAGRAGAAGSGGKAGAAGGSTGGAANGGGMGGNTNTGGHGGVALADAGMDRQGAGGAAGTTAGEAGSPGSAGGSPGSTGGGANGAQATGCACEVGDRGDGWISAAVLLMLAAVVVRRRA